MVGVLMLPETIHRRLDSVEEAGESRMTGRLLRPVWRGLRLASALSSVAWDGDRGKA